MALYQFSERDCIGIFNLEIADEIDPATNAYSPREVENEDMNNTTTELRVSHSYKLANQKSTLKGGLRFAFAWFKRQGGGEGTTASDFDLSITGDWGYNLDFITTNTAPFAENIFRVGNRFSITPGFRLEYLKSTGKGYKTTDNVKQTLTESRSRTFPLFGIGVEIKAANNTNIYGNFSQSYRPIDYSQLEPFGIT